MEIKEAQQTPCVQCKYYFNKEKIHCAIYPKGKETTYCGDWQLENISLEQNNAMINNLETNLFSYKKVASALLGITGATLLGYGLYQSVPAAINAYNSYDKYTQECKIFLERAGSAGTTGVAEEELAKAVNWLKVNYSTQSFEYKDLQANLNYLQKQPEDSVLSVVIRDSIKQNTNVIKNVQSKERDAGSFGLELIIILPIATLLTIVTFALLKVGLNYEQ